MRARQKKYHNPYDFMGPIRAPLLFAGRHSELEEIEYYLELSKDEKPKYVHLALVGPRSAGKTSFLNIIESTANDLGYLAVEKRRGMMRSSVSSRSTVLTAGISNGVHTGSKMERRGE
jgi:hypothetical protein